jgi:hypothetical protein
MAAMLVATPALAAPMTDWSAKDSGNPKSYSVAGLSITLSSRKNKDGDVVPALTVRTPGTPPFRVEGVAGFNPPMANFGVGRFDTKSPGPQILFTSFTGGAHCCNNISVIERSGGGWRRVDLGLWDGDGPENIPSDVDGDGAADFVFPDNAFLYTFDSYAGSRPPPRVLNVVGGKVVDLSTRPRFRKVFAQDMAQAAKACEQQQNGACAGYVADGARLGRFDAAWKFMLAHYDPQANWDYPTRCIGTMASDGACKGKELKPRDFPQALRWFLEDQQYIPKKAGD